MAPAAPIGGVMAAALAEHRDRCNALVAAARRTRSAFDTDLLDAQIRGPFTAVVEACETVAPGRGSVVLDTLFGPVVDLVGQHRLGGGPHDVLLATLPRLAGVLAAEPKLVFGSLANAVLVLARFDVPVTGWLERVVAGADAGGAPDEVLRSGQVAAWACGLAQYRSSALATAAGLPLALLRTALATPTIADVHATVDRLTTERWWRPDRPSERPTGPAAGDPGSPVVRQRVGGFRGFGGPFLQPPTAVSEGGAVVVRSGEDRWCLHADAFGATVTRAEPSVGGTTSEDARPGPPTVAGVDRVTSAARTADVLAVTTGTSYHVLVLDPGAP